MRRAAGLRCCYGYHVRWGLVLCAALVGCADATSASRTPSASVRSAPGATQGSAEAPPFTFVKIRINTDPNGATVKEDGIEQCSWTPCEITYSGPEADAHKKHKLVISMTGYGVETRTIKAGDPPLSVTLNRAWILGAPEASRSTMLPALRDSPLRDPSLGDHGSVIPY
jgi:hypothetical protein